MAPAGLALTHTAGPPTAGEGRGASCGHRLMRLLFPTGAPWQRGPPRRERNSGGCSRAPASASPAGWPGAAGRPALPRASPPAQKGGGAAVPSPVRGTLSRELGPPVAPPRFLHVGVRVQRPRQAETGDRAGPGPRLLLTTDCVQGPSRGVKAVGVSGCPEHPGPCYYLWQERISVMTAQPFRFLPLPRPGPSPGGVTRRAPAVAFSVTKGTTCVRLCRGLGARLWALAVSSCGPSRGLTWVTAQLIGSWDLLVGGPPSRRDITRPRPRGGANGLSLGYRVPPAPRAPSATLAPEESR